MGDLEEEKEIRARKNKQAERSGQTGEGRLRFRDLSALTETSGYFPVKMYYLEQKFST